MNYEFIAMVLGSGGGIIATWVRMTNDVTKIKSRLYSLEKKESATDKKLDALMDAIQEIKILLAKKGI